MSELMPMIPLRGVNVYPGMVVHFDLGREKSIVALERAMLMNQTVFLAAQKDVNTDLPTAKDVYNIGTVARVKQMLKLPGDNVRVLVDGLYRANLDEVNQEVPYFLVTVSTIEEDDPENPEADVIALMRTALELYDEYSEKHPRHSRENTVAIDTIKQGGKLADTIASMMQLNTEDAQKVLSTLDVKKRLRLIIDILKSLLTV